jgi:hypothetical protein
MPRLIGRAHHQVNYRHVIGSLVHKPGAFARYRYREDLYPSLTVISLGIDTPVDESTLRQEGYHPRSLQEW